VSCMISPDHEKRTKVTIESRREKVATSPRTGDMHGWNGMYA